ncbi:MAG: fibronectin type III domain-containing protein, partial [Paludibacteraceae bacterium]|nr:fibronectin type III domain-containing protein [Paludibacteraceae bacterium]
SAIIRWGESDGDYANSYDLYYATEAVQDFTDVVPQHDSIEALSIELTGLSEDTEYYVYIRTNCDGEGQSDGSSNWSDAYVFRTFANCQALSGLYVELLGKTSAQANWDATVQAPNFQYILSEEELDAEDLETAQLTEAGLVDTFAVMQDLTPGTTYYFYVANRCGEEEENHSVYVSTSFTMPVGCPAVENLEAYYKAFNAVGLKWNRGRFGEESEWEVGIVGEESSAQAVYDSTAIIVGLQPSTDYTFYVKAVCGVEDSSAVVTLAVRTNALPNDDVTIGEGASTGSGPINALYGYERNAYIFTPEDGLSAGTIESIEWHYTTADKTYPVEIYFLNTTQSSFGSVNDLVWNEMISSATLVYSGNVRTVNDWLSIDINDFDYTGDNLMILVATNYGGSGLYSAYAYYTNSGSNNHAYCRNDNYIDDDDSFSSCTSNGVDGDRHNIRINMAAQGTCRLPANVQASDITINSAKLTWFPGGAEVEWAMINSDVELSDAELNSMEADTLDVMEKSYDGLTPGIFYHFYIRSLCGEGDASGWKHLQYRTIPTCIEPVLAEPLLIDADSVVLTWTNGNEAFEGTYSLAFGLSATFNLADAETYTLIENIADDQYIIHGLSGSSKYRVAVKAVCTEDDESIWSNTIDFWSACMPITSLPWEENFDALTSGIPQCWDNSEGTTTTESYKWNYYSIGYNGVCVRFDSYMNPRNNTNTLKTPVIVIAEGDAAILSFYYKNPYGGDYSVLMSYDGGATYPETIATGLSAYSWTQFQYVIEPTAAEKQIVVAFKGTSNYDYGDANLYLDEVRISKLAVAATYYDQTCSGTAYQGHGFDIPASQVLVGEHTFTRVEEATSDLMADSLYTLVLNVGESKVTYLTDTACAYSAYDEYGFHIGSVNPNRTTPYERHEATVTGCDSLISLTLFVPQREFEVSDAICEGQEYQLGDTTLTTSGTYTRTLTGARFGCDSVVTLTLEVLPAHEEIEATICEGESYPFGGEDRTEAGTYEATLVNRLGCEYTVTLTLSVTEKTYYNYEAVFCAGDIYSDENFNGLDEGGIYKDTLSSVAGCDSIIVLNLIKHEPEEVDLNIEIADGDVYVFDNKTFDHDTTYTAHFVDQFSCDSIVTLHLTVATGLQEVLNDAQLKAAEKFMHNGILYIRANGILYDARGKRVMIRKEEE